METDVRASIVGGVAVGDISGDGLLEVVISTREGQLFVWDTLGPTRVGGRLSIQWQKFRNGKRVRCWL